MVILWRWTSNNNYHKIIKIIEIDLIKQQALEADPKTIQQIDFTGNLAREGSVSTTIFSLLKMWMKLF